MDAVFLKVLNLSLTASLLILAVLPIRLLMRKAPKWTTCLLWLIVAVALICPVRLESPVSVMPAEDPITITVSEPASTPLPPAQTTPILIQDIQNARQQSATTTMTVLEIGTLVWALGMPVLLGYGIFSYLQLKRRVAASLMTAEGVYLCDNIDTPFILGILRPRIYLPSTLDGSLHEAVLLHEQAHLQRRDHWWKPLGYVLLTIHWFNPLVWLSYILLCRDIELACDEKVIRNMDTQHKKHYSEALLQCSIPRHLITACPLAFGEVGAKQRIKAVLHYKKPAFWVIAAALLVCIGLCFAFLTKPTIKDDAPIRYAEVNSLLNTEPEHILEAQLQETRNYGVYVTQSLIGFEDYKELCTILSALETSSKPIANDGLTRFAEKVVRLTTTKGIVDFCFNRNFTEFWILSSGKESAVYEVRTPAPLRELYNRFDSTNYMEHKRIETLFQESPYGQTAGAFTVLQPHDRYYSGNFAVIAENDEQSTTAYLVEYDIDENGTYRLVDIAKGMTDARNGGYYLNLRNGEHTILWGFIPYENPYSDEDIIIHTTKETYTVPIYGAAFIAYLPKDVEFEFITCSNGQSVSLLGDWNEPATTPEPFTAADTATMQSLIEEHFKENNRHIANLSMFDYSYVDVRNNMTYAIFTVDHLSHDGSVLAENCLYLAGFTNGCLDGIASGEWGMSAGYYPNIADFNGHCVLWSTFSDTHIAINSDGTLNPNATAPNEYDSYHMIYDDGLVTWWNTDRSPLMVLPLEQGRTLVRIAPVDERGFDVEAFAFEGEHLTVTNVNTISEQSGWDVFLEMNTDTGNIDVLCGYPTYEDMHLYIDMDESFTGNEALYAALKESEYFDTWPADMKLMGQQSYGEYEYAVLQFAQMHGPTAALVEYTVEGSAVTIHSCGKGYAPDTQGFLIGYHMNMAFMEGGTMYWSLYAPHYATTKDGKDLADNNGLPLETVESNFTGFQFTMRDLKTYAFPAEESFFL